MKSEKKIEELKDTIQHELGIDITKYRDEEVAENLMDLLIFPKYILKWISRPVLICLLIYVLGFFIIDLVHIQFLIYGILGLVLFFSFGVFLGITYLSRKLGEDVSSIAEYSLGIVKNSVLDVADMGSKVDRSNIKDVLGLLFKGVVVVVTIPMIKKAISKKLPIGKGISKTLISGALMGVANRISFDEDKIDETKVVVDEEPKVISGYIEKIDKAKSSVNNVLDKVVRIANTPFRLIMYILGLILFIFIYLIW